MRTLWVISACMLLIVVLAACQPASLLTPPTEDMDPQEVPSEVPPTDLPENPLQFDRTPGSPEMPSNPPPVEKFVSLTIKDLGNRLQIDVNRISLVKSEGIIWPNAALGCPRPGQFYAPGRVPGFQIWLDVEGTEYIYNTDFNGKLVLCPELNPHLPNSTSGPTPGVPID